MKKLFLLLFIILGFGQIVVGQKFGYIDSDYILSQMPEYKQAQSEIGQLSKSWQNEIKQMYREIESMYNNLQAEEVLLTPEMKEERLAQIRIKEAEETM